MSKESSCFLNGLFFFTPLHFEVQGIRKEVEHMNDDDLIEEVSYLLQDDEYVDKIIFSYFSTRIILSHEREKLIWFYVLCTIEDYLMVMDDGEY